MKKDNQLSNQIKKLHYQLSFSEHTNKELANQLLHIQQTIPNKITSCHILQQHFLTINAQQHLQELFYIEPLLMAYQYQIHLLDQKLKELKDDSVSLLNFGEQIILQNNFLRKELQAKNEMILRSQNIGLNINFLKLDNQNLLQKNNLLHEKNNFLMHKINEIQKLNQRQKINDNQPNTSMAKVLKELRFEKQQSKQYQLKIIEAQNIHQLTTNQLNNQISIHEELERKNQLLQTQIYKAKHQIKIIKQQFQSYKIAHEVAINTHSHEIDTLKNQLSAIQRREHQIFTKNMSLQSELQDKDSKVHNLTLQNGQLQANNHNILQMLETYEAKVAGQNKKIKELELELKDYNQSMTIQKKDIQMLEWKLNQRQKDMIKRSQQWTKQRENKDKIWHQRLSSAKNILNVQRQQLLKQINRMKVAKQKLNI